MGILVTVLVGLTLVCPIIVVVLSRFISETKSNQFVFWFGSGCLRLANLLSGKTLFMVDYYGGYNLHFIASKEELLVALPDHVQPVPMRILEDDEPEHLVSIYVADTSMTNDSSEQKVPRADVFTYVRDKDGDLGLFFFSAIVDYSGLPPSKIAKKMVATIMHFFGLCPISFSIAYPHHDADSIIISDQELRIEHCDAKVAVSGNHKLGAKAAAPISTGNKFHRDFIHANSQIYRGPHGTKNTNFFNQSFSDSTVTSWDPLHVDAHKTTDLHPLCRQLVAVQSYRAPKGRPIRWYFENY